MFGEPVNTETANSKYSPNTFVQFPLRDMGGGAVGRDRKKILLYKELGWRDFSTVYRKVFVIKIVYTVKTPNVSFADNFPE